ncbi:MAG: TolC family protein, partial [Candidatus Eisenbacteria bacterium]|nr:TolC family protein [Candidatus Eisenbacteria bacterium]
AQVFAAGLLPDPSFSFSLDRPLEPQGLVTALTAALGLDIPALLHRPAAVREARANLDAVRYDLVWAEWLTAEQTRLVATRIPFLEETRELTSELRSLTQKELDRRLAAVSRGDLAAAQLEAPRLSASEAANRDREAESELEAAKLELNRVLGIDPREVIQLAPPEPSRSSLPTLDTMFERAARDRADLAGFRAAFEAVRAGGSAARLDRFPLPSLDFGAARDTGGLKTAGAGISFILPIWNRNRGEVAVTDATVARARADYAARLDAIRADLAAAQSALTVAARQHLAVSEELRELEGRLAANELSAERGDTSFSAAAEMRALVLDRRITQVSLARDVAELEIGLEIVCGQRLGEFQ